MQSRRWIKDPLWRFIVATLFWLPVFFAFWYLLAPVLLAPLVWLLKGVFAVIYPGLLDQAGLSGATMHVVTSLTVTAPDGREGHIALDINALKYAYNLPLLMALLFAAQDRDFSSNRIILCYLVLLPFQLWGVVFEILMNLAFRVGPDIPVQLHLDSAVRHFIALAYQLGVLMLPAISAATLWVGMNQRFIASLMLWRRQKGVPE
jgi:hypothetical protein